MRLHPRRHPAVGVLSRDVCPQILIWSTVSIDFHVLFCAGLSEMSSLSYIRCVSLSHELAVLLTFHAASDSLPTFGVSLLHVGGFAIAVPQPYPPTPIKMSGMFLRALSIGSCFLLLKILFLVLLVYHRYLIAKPTEGACARGGFCLRTACPARV